MDRKQDSVPKKPEQEATPYDLDGRPRLAIALPVGLQHVLAMFVGNLTPLIVIMGLCGITVDGGMGALRITLLQNAMLIAGIVTLVQVFTIGPVGANFPSSWERAPALSAS